MNIIETKTTRVKTCKRIELTAQDLRRLIAAASGDITLPVEAEIFVEIPGGADWSNTLLEIDKENPVVITWTEIVEEQG